MCESHAGVSRDRSLLLHAQHTIVSVTVIRPDMYENKRYCYTAIKITAEFLKRSEVKATENRSQLTIGGLCLGYL